MLEPKTLWVLKRKPGWNLGAFVFGLGENRGGRRRKNRENEEEEATKKGEEREVGSQ